MTEFVGQSGIRIGADERIGDAGEFGDVRAHLFGAERAVQSDRQRRGMRNRIPECLRRLPGEKPPGSVGDGAGNHHRQADAARLHHFSAGEDRGLGVERVEDRLDQQNIDAAVDQSAHLLGISGAQFIEGDGAEARIEHVGRDRRGRLVGPMAPATKRGRPSSSCATCAAMRASLAPSRFSS